MKSIFLAVMPLLVLAFLCYCNRDSARNDDNYKNDRTSLRTKNFEVDKQMDDSVIWRHDNGTTQVYLYSDDLDMTNYDHSLTEIERDGLFSYENSSYAKNGYADVQDAFLKAMDILSDSQVKIILGDCSKRNSVVSLYFMVYKGRVVKLRFFFLESSVEGKIPDKFIVLANKKIRTAKFYGFESYGITTFAYNMPIRRIDIQKYLQSRSSKK